MLTIRVGGDTSERLRPLDKNVIETGAKRSALAQVDRMCDNDNVA